MSLIFSKKEQKVTFRFVDYTRSCFDCKSTKNLRAIHNCSVCLLRVKTLFRLQKYKKFESNSQQQAQALTTKVVVSTAKVQKI